MGHKSIKEHYKIGHFVTIQEKGICIGSPYIHDIIIVGRDGKTIKKYDSNSNKDLVRYQSEIDADPELFVRLLNQQDEFSASLPVYTYEGGKVIEKQCEAYGWPNVTHDGEMMYENSYSKYKETVIRWAKKNAKAGIEIHESNIKDLEEKIIKQRKYLAECQDDLDKLNKDYP